MSYRFHCRNSPRQLSPESAPFPANLGLPFGLQVRPAGHRIIGYQRALSNKLQPTKSWGKQLHSENDHRVALDLSEAYRRAASQLRSLTATLVPRDLPDVDLEWRRIDQNALQGAAH
ncbi:MULTISPECIES: hypothetical protein [Bradyrhizobium]|uniref:Uncharacterized protein n=2 Tax=Bradyrhizobium quebecense TaxID=2748629 RepID=A0ACD3VLW8_9BRAD|nr:MULTISPECIES: hypothetical protein [Bradyrhizobium]UFX49382.1 hypothetical protein HAP47_0040570 [Bradyrhizobium sp. 41S5]UGY07476.1 hypothetical protein J4P68_0040645 [Bradyrhizobium quebecense]